MRMKTIQAVRSLARWVQRILDARVPWDAVHGIRPR